MVCQSGNLVTFCLLLVLAGCVTPTQEQRKGQERTQLTLPHQTIAASHTVGSAAELAGICRTVQPGEAIVLSDGTYTDQHFVFKATGTKERPISLRAQTPGKVILNGSSRLSIGGEYLAVDGLQFRGGALKSGSVIEFRARSSPPTRHCILRNTAIVDYNPPGIDTRYFWVSLYGTDNTVERCWFSGQAHSGVTVCVWLEGGKTARHIIRRNYFANRPPGNGNGFETIRIGTSTRSMTAARCVVSENLFEECNGEIEIISNKSCENTYALNTFLHCSGCLTLRHGNRCEVKNNVFIGGDAKGAGGVRVIGEGHRITGNHFSGTKGRAGGAISLQAGIPDSPLSGYFQVKNCVVDGNTFVDNPGALFALDAGYGRKGCKLLPESVTIANNLMAAPKDAKPMIVATNPSAGIVWKSNLAVGGELGIDKPGGIQLAPSIPSNWKHRQKPQPLKRTDVGPKWMRVSNTLGGLPPVQAESVRSSNAGRSWQERDVRAAPDASIPPDERNLFGGAAGARKDSEGFFRVRQEGHRWWLVDPDGCLFFTIGVNSVDPARIGSDGDKDWARDTHELLTSAGFNTLGRWSKVEPFQAAGREIAWCSSLSFMGTYKRQRPKSRGQPGYPNETMPVFDPEWPAFCERYAREKTQPLKKQRWLVGHFSDNELPFRPDALAKYLSLPETDPGHRAAIAWMDENRVPRDRINDRRVRGKFLEMVASRYFSTVAAALKKADPDHLYLGSRVHGRCISEPVFRGAKDCDVISVNYYHRWEPEKERLANWTKWSGRPFLVGEFYAMKVTSEDTKAHGAGFRVLKYSDAVKFYQTFTVSLLRDIPSCVGWHWFKYADDSADWHKGIVGRDGDVHRTLLEGMTRVNRRAYSLRGLR